MYASICLGLKPFYQYLMSNLHLNSLLNQLRMNNKFEKIDLFHCMNFRQRLTFNLREIWHTLYAMLLSKIG